MSQETNRLRYLCSAHIRRGDRKFVEDLLAKAEAAIVAGNGTIGVLLSGAANGKTGTRQIVLDPLATAETCQAALDEFDGRGSGSTGITVPDFSGLEHIDPFNGTLPR